MTAARLIRLLATLSLAVLCGCSPGGPRFTTTPEFLGPDDFDGAYRRLRWPVPMGGQSSFDGEVVFTNLPRDAVEAVLPDDLRLAPNGRSPDEHPVVLVFGVQRDLAWVFPGGASVDVDRTYGELMVLIPFVQHERGRYWHNYVMRMYLDWQWAVDAGNTYFGFRKEVAEFVRDLPPPDDHTMHVRKNDRVIWEGDVTGAGPWMDREEAEDDLANYRAMREIFRMPMLGTLSMLTSDEYLCSYFDWSFREGALRRSEVEYAYLENFVPGMGGWTALGELANVPDGGFGVESLRWRMTAGFPCRF